MFPGNTEICDGLDNSCSAGIDEGCDWYCDDDDNDGWTPSSAAFTLEANK